ncbi:MAG: hypothetical protein U0T83_07980 [Bacteriovoracaceae bacterium]
MRIFLYLFLLLYLPLYNYEVIAEDTAKLFLVGYVRSEMGVSIASQFTRLSLEEVRDIQEIEITSFLTESNFFAGYKISVNSQNGGVLKNGESIRMPYTVKVGKNTLDISKKESPLKISSNGKQALKIRLPASDVANSFPNGQYSDVLYLNVKAI